MTDSQRAWSAALAQLDFSFTLEDAVLTWRGRLGTEQVVLTLDAVGERGAVSVSVTGVPPELGRLVTLPRAALLDTALALETGDAELDARVAVLPRDPWAMARLDSATRARLVRLTPVGVIVTPSETRLRTSYADGWGDAETIADTLRSLSDLSAALRAPLDDPAAQLEAIADHDPDPSVRARAAALLDDPDHRAARRVWVLPLDEVDTSEAGFTRLSRLAAEADAIETRVAALRHLLLRFGPRALEHAARFTGPALDDLTRRVVGALGPDVDDELLAALESHPSFGLEVRRWALTRAHRGGRLEVIRRALGDVDADLRREAITQLVARFPLSRSAPLLRAVDGPFTKEHVSLIAVQLRDARPPELDLFPALEHVARNVVGDREVTSALCRMFGALGDERAIPLLERAAEEAREGHAASALVALWSCGATFADLRRLSPFVAWPSHSEGLLEEIARQGPRDVGRLLGALLDATLDDGSLWESHHTSQLQRHRHALAALMIEAGDPAALPSLRRFTEERNDDVEMFAAIGALGELEDIERLAPFTKGFLRTGDAKDKARAAIARIQARLGLDGQAGSLSIAGADGGRLQIHDPDDARSRGPGDI